MLKKYNLIFSYFPEAEEATAITSISSLLSDYIGVHNTKEAAGMLLFIVTEFVRQNQQEELILREVNGIKARITRLDATLFIETTEDAGTVTATDSSFVLPLEDFIAVAQSWKLFLEENRTRRVEVKDGRGIINIISDRFANALVIEKAVAVNWPDCGGSIGEYYSVSKQPYEKQKELTAGINAVLASGTDSVVFDAISRFLSLFTDGEYLVTIDSIDLDCAEFEYDGLMTYAGYVTEEERFTCNFYPYGTSSYLFTRSYGTIDQERVAYYAERIKEGERPKAVIYSHNYPGEAVENPQYVIDGHHKLLAYQQLRITPSVILINKQDDVGWPLPNIILQIAHVLNPAELEHILVSNDNIADINIYMSEEVTQYLDVIFSKKCSIGISLTELLYNTYHSIDEAQRNWAKKRLTILRKNKNQGNRQYLYYRTKDEEKGYTGWRGLYIENDRDFDQWEKILLNDQKPSALFLERQKGIDERYRLINLQRFGAMVLPQPQSRQIINQPYHAGKSGWFYFRIIVLIILLIKVLMALLM